MCSRLVFFLPFSTIKNLFYSVAKPICHDLEVLNVYRKTLLNFLHYDGSEKERERVGVKKQMLYHNRVENYIHSYGGVREGAKMRETAVGV